MPKIIEDNGKFVTISLPHNHDITIHTQLVFMNYIFCVDGNVYEGVPKSSEFYRKVIKLQREEKLRRILKC